MILLMEYDLTLWKDRDFDIYVPSNQGIVGVVKPDEERE
jgi:hypothetical protein